MDGLTHAQLIGEDRENAGVRVFERLAFAIHVLETEDNRWNSKSLGSNAQQVLLRQLGGGIDRCGRGLRALWRRDRLNFASTGGPVGFATRRPLPQGAA